MRQDAGKQEKEMGAVQLKEEAMDALNYQQLKSDIHRTLLAKIDLEKLAAVNNGRAVQTINLLIQDIVAKEKVPLSAMEKEKLQTDLVDEIFGLGPLEPLLKDHTISDILGI